MATVLLACGVDPKSSIFFPQSKVSSHCELTWLLSCITPMNLLNAMIQYKEKVRTQNSAHLGLLSYPVLMAADILLYQTTHVPVGIDQEQHLQLARDLAQKSNREWKKDIFVVPEIMLTQSSRIMSLQNASKKMSKSDPNENSRILLRDTDVRIAEKIKRAKTDSIHGISYEPEARPELANLLTIFSTLARRPIEDIVKEEASSDMLQFKLKLTELVIAELIPLQKRLELLNADPGYVEKILDEGGDKARAIAEQTLNDLKKQAGLL